MLKVISIMGRISVFTRGTCWKWSVSWAGWSVFTRSTCWKWSVSWAGWSVFTRSTCWKWSVSWAGYQSSLGVHVESDQYHGQADQSSLGLHVESDQYILVSSYRWHSGTELGPDVQSIVSLMSLLMTNLAKVFSKTLIFLRQKYE